MYTGLALNLLTSFSIAVEYMEHDKEYNAIPKNTLDVKAMIYYFQKLVGVVVFAKLQGKGQ